MRPANMIPGDILLYKGTDALGIAIDWAEWVTGRENAAYCHAAMWYGERVDVPGLWIIRQNPGGPAFEPDSAQPWDKIDVLRLTLENGVQPGLDPNWVGDHFKPTVAGHMQDGYAYLEIWDYFKQDLLARVGHGQEAEKTRRLAASYLSYHFNCCSEFDRINLGEATNKWLNRLGPLLFDLLPGVGPGQARPADLANSPFLKRITA